MTAGLLPGPCVVIPQYPAYGSGAAQVSFPETGGLFVDSRQNSPQPNAFVAYPRSSSTIVVEG